MIWVFIMAYFPQVRKFKSSKNRLQKIILRSPIQLDNSGNKTFNISVKKHPVRRPKLFKCIIMLIGLTSICADLTLKLKFVPAASWIFIN